MPIGVRGACVGALDDKPFFGGNKILFALFLGVDSEMVRFWIYLSRSDINYIIIARLQNIRVGVWMKNRQKDGSN